MTKEEEKEEQKSLLEQSRETAAELKQALAQLKEEREKLEELKARDILGGKSEAGSVPEKPKELTPAEYAKKVLQGDI